MKVPNIKTIKEITHTNLEERKNRYFNQLRLRAIHRIKEAAENGVNCTYVYFTELPYYNRDYSSEVHEKFKVVFENEGYKIIYRNVIDAIEIKWE